MREALIDQNSKYYLIGGEIASLADAAFLIRDGDIKGHQISILEQSNNLGGSLDAGGNARDGYSMRGGRMLESKYVCTFDLFSSIPVFDGSRTVTEETFAVNRTVKTHSKARLFREGRRVEAPVFGLTERNVLTLERLILEPENRLINSRRTSSSRTFGTCGAPRLRSSRGIVRSSSNATWFASPIWCPALTP